MSFGPSDAQKKANQQQQSITDTAVANSANINQQGSNLLNLGQQNTTAGTNFFNTILNGDAANTSALMAPTIQQNRATTQGTIQALTDLAPRGGGRSGTLFNAAYAPSAANTSTYNAYRTAAATALPQIGLQEEGMGGNLFGVGNQALNTGNNSNQAYADALAKQRQATLAGWSALGGGLFNLATTPFGGGAAANGLLGMIK